MHTLIAGTTGSGKTTLAKVIANESASAVIVFDPHDSDWGKKARVIGDIDVFVKTAKDGTNCLLIVDEAGISLNSYDPDHRWLATTSRHNGHRVIFISQRPTMVHPHIRNQCEHAMIFRVDRASAKLIGEDYAVESVEQKIVTLPRFHFLRLGRFAKPEQCIVKGTRIFTIASP